MRRMCSATIGYKPLNHPYATKHTFATNAAILKPTIERMEKVRSVAAAAIHPTRSLVIVIGWANVAQGLDVRASAQDGVARSAAIASRSTIAAP
jgi:hypothetical protein